MPRYELWRKRRGLRHFWTIELLSQAHLTTYGHNRGAPGPRRLTRFATDDLAEADYDKRIAEKLANGYVLGRARKPGT